MLHAMFEQGEMFVAAVLCSASIKLLDDFLDRETDAASGITNSIHRLGEGVVAYCLPLLAASVALQPKICVCLLFASWAVGMFHDLTVRFPFGIRGWQESVIVTAAGVYLTNWRAMLFAMLLVVGVQLFDDIIDQSVDGTSGIRNWAKRWGVLPCSTASLICILTAWELARLAFWPVLLGIALVYYAFFQSGGGIHG